MADSKRDKCDKCGMISEQCGMIRNFYHYIYDEKLGKTQKVKTSRLAGEGELLFCSYKCRDAYLTKCGKCQKYLKGENYQKHDKNDNKRFCSKKCCDDYYAPTCSYCHQYKGYWNKPKKNDDKHFCSKSCLEIFYAPLCDICQEKCLKYSHGKPIGRDCYYNDAENKTGEICSNCNKKKSEYTCSKCGNTKLGQYYYNKEKNDGEKFCSDNCYGIYYGHYIENCQECSKKLFKSYKSWCSSCELKHQIEARKKEAEQKKKEKKLKDNCYGSSNSEIVYCRYCGVKCPSIFDVCDKKECLNKQKEEHFSNERSNSINKNNNPIATKRERQNLLQYFITNNIQSARLDNNKLLIKYNHKEEEEEEPKTTELQQIKDYIQQQPTKTLTLSDLEKKNNSSNGSVDNKDKRNNTALIIVCSVIGVVLISLVLILIRKSKNRKKH